MKLMSLLCLVGAAAVLPGCAIGPNPPDTSQLSVHPDNHVAYTMLSRQGGAERTRVWSTGEIILALRFGNRILNSKDIESVVVKSTGKKYVPLNISVHLKSGEMLAADVAGWGTSVYSDIFVDWLACSRSRQCEYLDRTSTPKFKKVPNFLTSFNESFFEDLASPGKNVEQYLSYIPSAALPDSSGSYRLIFGDVAKISDLSGGIEAARVELQKVRKCVQAAAAAENRDRKATEENIIKTTPPAEVAKKLAMWRATLNEGFARGVVLDMGCR
ncbi:hypothetical protein [Rugamonas sp. DEMB1]|uniref:hypothetical protein n=1 Tax=Rugamonas sp. DEMB1 TaxID=3039386 RepID=UPI00244A60CF|nr:hypothetical protein [Rugamonas sp. DEMB1]WGG48903.1 hypothetical protein QC826_19945 [Rugamonas sp. DEMB1]